MQDYFSGQGKLYVSPIVAGVPGAFRWFGNTPSYKVQFSTSKKQHKESSTGQRLLDNTLTTENKATVSAELEAFSEDNLALAVRGAATAIASGTVVTGTPDICPADTLKVGEMWPLRHQMVSTVVIKDSASTPVTVNSADYIVDPTFGTVTFGNIGSYTQPFKASYSYAAVKSTGFFTQPITEVALRFHGLNTVTGDTRRVLVETYRVALDPTKELGLISDDYGKFVLDGDGLQDPTRNASDPAFGPFGRMMFLTPA